MRGSGAVNTALDSLVETLRHELPVDAALSDKAIQVMSPMTKARRFTPTKLRTQTLRPKP
jgi:hypothetical protein